MERRCGLLEWQRTLLSLIDILHEHSSLQQVARTVLLAEHDDEGGLLGLTCATRAGLSSGLRRLPLRACQARPGAKAGTLQAACDRRTASYSVRRVGRSKGLSAGELTGMYCTAAWPVPLSSHWPSSLRQYTLARWRASAPLSPMLAHPALGPGARAAACCSAEPGRRQRGFASEKIEKRDRPKIGWFLFYSLPCLALQGTAGTGDKTCNSKRGWFALELTVLLIDAVALPPCG